MGDPTTKVCTRCGADKPLSEFYKNTRYTDGYVTWCKPCYKAYRLERRADPALVERDRKRGMDWYYAHHDEKKARNNARSRERWHTDPAYRERKNRQHYEGRFRPHRIEKTRMRARMDRSKRRALERKGPGVTAEQWLAICATYNHRCLACGAAGHLEMDHIVPLSKGGPHTPDNVQPLCVPCNRRKADRTIDYRPPS